VEAALAEGRDVLFDIEWQGHRQLKASMPADVTSIFLLPPSMAELEQRLRNRGQDSDAEIVNRMAAAREEITHWDEFDHVLINQDFDATVATARAILHAARSTRARQPGMAGFIKGLLGACVLFLALCCRSLPLLRWATALHAGVLWMMAAFVG
jgi:guanylate kinase